MRLLGMFEGFFHLQGHFTLILTEIAEIVGLFHVKKIKINSKVMNSHFTN